MGTNYRYVFVYEFVHVTLVSTRRHPAQPVSVPILNFLEAQALWFVVTKLRHVYTYS